MSSALSNRFYFTANWITLLRVLFVIPMIYFYYRGNLLWAGTCFILSIVPDWVDGWYARKQARRYQLPVLKRSTATFWQELNYRGETELGAVLDPLFDKVTNGLGLFLAAWGFLPGYEIGLICLAILVDLFLQFVIRPFKKRHEIGNLKATDWGKYKTQSQGWTAGFMPFWHLWQWPHPEAVFGICLLICLGFGIMSARSHIIPILAWRKQQRK